MSFMGKRGDWRVDMNRLAIKGARLFDGRNPGPRDSLVLVEGERITWVGDDANQPVDLADYRLLDARSQTLLPGLVNCHVHITADPDPKFMPSARPQYAIWVRPSRR